MQSGGGRARPAECHQNRGQQSKAQGQHGYNNVWQSRKNGGGELRYESVFFSESVPDFRGHLKIRRDENKLIFTGVSEKVDAKRCKSARRKQRPRLRQKCPPCPLLPNYIQFSPVAARLPLLSSSTAS